MNFLQHCTRTKPNISGTILGSLLTNQELIYYDDISLLISGYMACVGLSDLDAEAILAKLEQYKSIMIAAVPDQFVSKLRNVTFKGDLHQLYVCTKIPKITDISWQNGQDRYEMKSLTLEIVEYVMAHSTINYPKEYIEMLAVKLNHFTCVVYCNDTPVSWCLTHSDLSIGLMGTVESHRGQGLAKKCVNVVLNRHFGFFRDKTEFFAYCYIKDDNIASSKAMAASGFEASGQYVRWVRLQF